MNQNNSAEERYYELWYYTLAHKDPRFIHQHIVDAFAAQTANQNTKPIKVAFALIGLYLYLEKNYTGKQVQLAHIALANRQKEWPKFDLPESRGEITVADVLSEPAGQKRDGMIRAWCASVWEAYRDSHAKVSDLVSRYLDEGKVRKKRMMHR
jgi:hypothetical protein